jgi:alkyl hydroperoxide reductase subunit D
METIIENETLRNLYVELGIENYESDSLNQLAKLDARYLKDLKINVSNALKASTLSRKEALLIALAISHNEKKNVLIEGLTSKALVEGVEDGELGEMIACVSLMNTNNVYYRFKHFAKKEYYENALAGIKMSIMANPILGKEFFELLSLVVSAINGCELCVNSHEASVRQHGASEARVLEAIRLGAVMKGLTNIL